MTPQATVGTPADGYRVAPAEHPFTARPADLHDRPVCQCGRGRGDALHLTTRRSNR